MGSCVIIHIIHYNPIIPLVKRNSKIPQITHVKGVRNDFLQEVVYMYAEDLLRIFLV